MVTKSPILFFILMTVLSSGIIKSQPVHILPLGNSITQSDNAHKSYRYALWTKLIVDGLDFNFVGSLTSNHGGVPVFPQYDGQDFDQNHEGHWGWRADQLVSSLPNWLPGYTPDIVLLHIGTNDLYQEGGSTANIAQTIAEIEDIITILRNDNPNVVILLAKIIPSTLPGLINTIPSLNQSIPQVATDMYDPDSPVIIIDQFEGFDASTDTFDGTHPNEVGEEKMAQKWRDAIVQALSSGLRLNLKLFLEGPFNGIKMDSSLASGIPLQQPFNAPPWNYSGMEAYTTLPSGIVDWVLVELRDTTQVEMAGSSTIIARQACLLNTDGDVLNTDGSADITFDVDVSDSLFVVINHRNHLPVISANPLQLDGGVYSWNFTDAIDKAYGGGNAQKELPLGSFALYAGDFNSDGSINEEDYGNVWYNTAGSSGILPGDSNLDGRVSNRDKNDFWFVNQGHTSQVP